MTTSQRALMRGIWAWSKGTERVKRTHTPWLVENLPWVPDENDTDVYGRPRIRDHRVEFPETRKRIVPRWELYQRFRQSTEYLYWQAVSARELAQSYRQFNVGCALLAFRPDRPHRQSYEVHVGMNLKVAQQARPVCAEPIAIGGAHGAGCSRAIGMVIVGELREEDVDVLKTLHPCTECRLLMEDHPIIRPDTIIVTARPPVDGRVPEYEIRTFKRLLEFHRLLELPRKPAAKDGDHR
ncbi:MAG TPA: hypothetical protein VEA36_00890 [Candidatus Paceibacterota bacterium]|nr:hypothetical protein [Candidatus Paceibacterota bacterium]